MHEGQPPVRFVTLRISATIANEYANRCPEWLSEELDEGLGLLSSISISAS